MVFLIILSFILFFTQDCHHPLLDAPQRPPRPANDGDAYDDPSLINLTTFNDVSDEEDEEEQRLICTCQTCQLNSTDSVSAKYSEDRMHLREIRNVVDNVKEYEKKFPNIFEAMMLFEKHCLNSRKGRNGRRVNNSNEGTVTTNNAVNQDDGGMDQSFLRPLNKDHIPDKFVVLGLAAKAQAEIDRGEPPNEAYAFFQDRLDEAYSQYRKGIEARKRKDFTSKENRSLCQIVKVSCIMVSKVIPCIAALTLDVHLTLVTCYLLGCSCKNGRCRIWISLCGRCSQQAWPLYNYPTNSSLPDRIRRS